MPKTTDSVIFSDIEQEILETALRNPELSNSEIADRTGARLTLVRDTRRNYEDEVELSEAAAEAAETPDPPAGVDDSDLSDTQLAILEALQAEPTLSNAEIADRTGARIALVRDTRTEYGEAVTAAESAADDDAGDADDDSADADDGPSETQAEILELAAAEPNLSNAELADRTDNRITLVRDTLREFDTDAFSDTQVDIIETALDDPELTNAEIADRTGSRITLVRDTIRAYDSEGDGSDDTETGADTSDESDTADVLADVDTDAFSETQLNVLETALANPELTNAEIAAETGTRIALVRDTRFDHEYDEKPWAGDVDEPDDGDDDEGGEAATESTPTSTEPELPETTASELLSAAEREILETALEDPELTNAEIADETGSRITLVRDTRRTYEDAVDLAEPTDDADATETAVGGEPEELPETTDSELLSDAEREVLETALENPESTNAEIADETGSRITLVRDTRRTYEDAVDLAEPTDDADATETAVGGEPEELPETTDSELLSDAEREVLETALENPELTNAEIAEQTGSRITLVRDTRRSYEDAVDLADGDGSGGEPTADSTPESAEVDQTEAADAAESTGSAEPAGGSEGGLNTGLIVALLIGLLLVIAIAASLL